MIDLIDRQAAINAIENTDCELSSDAWDELTDAIMSLLPAQPEPRWIPVKKKPKAIGSYLCFEEGGFCYVDIWNGANWELIVKAYARPIAYMPLPKPYREEDANDKDYSSHQKLC